jgi:hypothetical protein
METILKLQQDEKGKWAEVIIDGYWGIINRKNPSQLADFDEFIKNK